MLTLGRKLVKIGYSPYARHTPRHDAKRSCAKTLQLLVVAEPLPRPEYKLEIVSNGFRAIAVGGKHVRTTTTLSTGDSVVTPAREVYQVETAATNNLLRRLPSRR